MAKFMRRGTTKVYWLPTVANTSAPTAAELAAGTDLTSSIGGISGFNFKSTQIEIPNLGTRQTPKIPGQDQSDDSSLKFYEDDTTNTLYTTLAKDEDGYLLFFNNGQTATASKVNVFPATVSSNTPEYSLDNVAAMFNVDFSITGEVKQQVAMAA